MREVFGLSPKETVEDAVEVIGTRPDLRIKVNKPYCVQQTLVPIRRNPLLDDGANLQSLINRMGHQCDE